VVPKPLQTSYTDTQRQWLWDVKEFAKFIAAKQAL